MPCSIFSRRDVVCLDYGEFGSLLPLSLAPFVESFLYTRIVPTPVIGELFVY